VHRHVQRRLAPWVDLEDRRHALLDQNDRPEGQGKKTPGDAMGHPFEAVALASPTLPQKPAAGRRLERDMSIVMTGVQRFTNSKFPAPGDRIRFVIAGPGR
jgi:hypothetical protein